MKSAILSLALLLAVGVVDAGTDKTNAPTPGNERPTLSPSQPPVTPFPTEAPELTLVPVRLF